MVELYSFLYIDSLRLSYTLPFCSIYSWIVLFKMFKDDQPGIELQVLKSHYT